MQLATIINRIKRLKAARVVFSFSAMLSKLRQDPAFFDEVAKPDTFFVFACCRSYCIPKDGTIPRDLARHGKNFRKIDAPDNFIELFPREQVDPELLPLWDRLLPVLLKAYKERRIACRRKVKEETLPYYNVMDAITAAYGEELTPQYILN